MLLFFESYYIVAVVVTMFLHGWRYKELDAVAFLAIITIGWLVYPFYATYLLYEQYDKSSSI